MLDQAGSRIVKFCRLRLGLKGVVDRWQTRQNMMGLAHLPIRTVLDIGANVGKKARQFRRCFPEAHIYCFEPLPVCQERLRGWIATQGGRATLFPLALGAEPGQSAIWWQKNQWGGSSLWEPTDLRREQAERIAIEIETLDRVMAHVALHDDLLIKLDVEGYELEVMRGGRDTLGRARALIVELPLVEANHRPRFAEVVEFLDDLGFLYRGNLACAWVDGIPRLADAVFCKREASLSAA